MRTSVAFLWEKTLEPTVELTLSPEAFWKNTEKKELEIPLFQNRYLWELE